MSESSKRHLLRFVALLAALAVIAAACGGGESTDTTEGEAGETTTTAADGGGEETTTTEGDGTTPPSGEAFTYALGMTSDITTTNYWNYIGPEGTVYNQYVLAGTKPSLFGIEYPAIAVVPNLAVGLPAEPVEGDAGWVVTQQIRDDMQWSDGTPVTANDIAFTFTAVKDATLGGDWLSSYPYTEESDPQLLSVDANSDTEVVFTFSARPGLGVWPHNVGVATIMPAHVWQPVLDEALASEDPAAAMYGADGSIDVSAGPVVFSSWEEGAFVTNLANDNYSDRGLVHKQFDDGTVQLGDEMFYGEGTGEVLVEYAEGPFMTEQTFAIYSDQSAAMLALVNGEIDYWINPLGVSPGLREQGLSAENLSVAVNPTNGMRYLAFNLRKSPGSYQGYRQAVAYMIDKEFLTQNVLQGVAFPMYIMTPEGNQKYFDAELEESVSSQYTSLDVAGRLAAAVEALKGDGFTWESEPTIDEATGEVVAGVGLTDPEGNLVEEQEILAPGQAYDPLRATASLWIEGWMEQLGIPARANPTDFNTIVAQVWPGVGEEIGFDTYILGWSLGNPALPTFYESFFHSRNLAEVNDGNNSHGLQDEEVDALADAVNAAQTEEEAIEAISAVEAALAEKLPYVVLFDTPITEFYSSDLAYPFTQTLSGLQFQIGLPGAVAK